MSQESLTSQLPGDFAARCRKLGSSTLFEASGLPCAADPQIRGVWDGAFIAAPAFPLECSPGDNLGIHVAMEQVPRGAVLVVSTSNFIAGYWGEVLTVAAEAAGVVGLIIDGGVRDVAALRARNFPAFSRGISVRGTVKASLPSVGKPINFTGVRVARGDLVVADDDGVIVIPQAEAERTILAGEERAAKEAAMMQKLANGAKTLDLLGLTHWRALK
ncbi:4-carboxy-4-hydroxy-2-oxoadipate aldolase/oxaloacetate decarboxylase [Paraburkholderia fungorum]|uniref:Dimethylmenaquinone methyltransferase n=1 Tax=Paraburkholderia fungorum TaxID=134537 RepID=A0A420GYG2_9BURK|nr:4-carboxy-4-hydroxy-2-oxoadipate aldolase/oxaloacetate decarboxylase [Paraburkholderia fungorum]RKF50113.1 dimethylmenaquinone methyltransferase [Paraburkholderia fungorum]